MQEIDHAIGPSPARFNQANVPIIWIQQTWLGQMNEWTASPALLYYRILSYNAYPDRYIWLSTSIVTHFSPCTYVRDPVHGWTRDCILFGDRYYVRKLQTIPLPTVSISFYAATGILSFHSAETMPLRTLIQRYSHYLRLKNHSNDTLHLKEFLQSTYTALRQIKINIRSFFSFLFFF